MSSQTNLSLPDTRTVVLGLYRADKRIKESEKEKKDLREALFHIATVEGENEVLARRTTKLPVGFLNRIGMQENHFIASRWPGWRKVESRKVNDAGEEDQEGQWIEYLLEQDPAYLPWKTEATEPGYIVTAGRSIQQNAPEIDQRTLQKDLPEVFDKIMKPHVVYEVDVEKMQTLIAEDPTLLAKLELHFAYPAPIVKLSPIKEVTLENE